MKSSKSYKRRKLKIAGAVTLLVGVLALHFYVPRFITEIENPLLNILRGSNLISSDHHFDNDESKGRHFEYLSHDNLRLKGYLTLAATEQSKGTIILVHGIRSKKEHFMQLSDEISKRGYSAVAIDLRAHGASEGKHCTFGYQEKRDISALVDYLLRVEKVHPNIGIWGQSLGGAVAFQTLAIDNRIKFGIIESTFSNLDQVVQNYALHFAGFNIPPITRYMLKRAGVIANFPPTEIDLPTMGRQINQPVLMVHGTHDRRIDINNSHKNLQSLRSKQKRLLEIEGAGHLNVWAIGGDEYFHEVFNFINYIDDEYQTKPLFDENPK